MKIYQKLYIIFGYVECWWLKFFFTERARGRIRANIGLSLPLPMISPKNDLSLKLRFKSPGPKVRWAQLMSGTTHFSSKQCNAVGIPLPTSLWNSIYYAHYTWNSTVHFSIGGVHIFRQQLWQGWVHGRIWHPPKIRLWLGQSECLQTLI